MMTQPHTCYTMIFIRLDYDKRKEQTMQLHILNNPKDAPLVEDAAFLKAALFDLLQRETTPAVADTLAALAEAEEGSSIIKAALPALNEQQTQNLIIACGLFAQILSLELFIRFIMNWDQVNLSRFMKQLCAISCAKMDLG
mgnify:CR=1 FL=1